MKLIGVINDVSIYRDSNGRLCIIDDGEIVVLDLLGGKTFECYLTGAVIDHGDTVTACSYDEINGYFGDNIVLVAGDDDVYLFNPASGDYISLWCQFRDLLRFGYDIVGYSDAASLLEDGSCSLVYLDPRFVAKANAIGFKPRRRYPGLRYTVQGIRFDSLDVTFGFAFCEDGSFDVVEGMELEWLTKPAPEADVYEILGYFDGSRNDVDILEDLADSAATGADQDSIIERLEDLARYHEGVDLIVSDLKERWGF